ncbi:MAG: T9SS type A sorting domain-containing protein, partial [Candidatus Marinimicrobia bacterium]|nr:T9SS type A sorting domain-containing protein [Candidatus Neomarinimicrobiota bacterium]
PADYEIEFFDQIIGTDSSSTPVDVNFTVVNITENRPANFRFQDRNGDGFWSSMERIRIREIFEGSEEKTWLVTLMDTTGTGDGVAPGEGDVFQIKTTKPFRSGDVFRFPEVITAIAFWPDETNSPYTYSLLQNYPNPFNPETTIQYSLAASGRVVIHIYNILGRKVRTLVDDVQEEGFHKVQWDGKDNFGRNIASGIYLYRIRSGDFVYTRKLLLLR